MFTQRDRERCAKLLAEHYAGRKFHDARYREMIAKHLKPGSRMLDAGCGHYLTFCHEFADRAHVVGIDLEPTLETRNQQMPFGIRGDLSHLPFPDNYFDIVITRSVVEHLTDPKQVFREFGRVLRTGGKVVVITPNKYDYVSIIAALTPYWLHRTLVSKIFPVSEDDVFPTLYRANTLGSLESAFQGAGFATVELEAINHYPAYLMFSPVLFRLGMWYENLTSLHALRSLRASLLGVFEKRSAGPGAGSNIERNSSLERVPVGV